MIYLYKIISFFLAFIVVSISFYVVYVIYVCIAKCVEKIKIWKNKNKKWSGSFNHMHTFINKNK
jgi:uncharacterized membrane protein YagU involved in acid resistance